ncbi:hypothetical protein [Streptomyces sp. URMC 123]|uniref:hypothetical protein n=1 Tax=Streptomyces sp. URMC 123 TaxID=3423403 RepID=UPI003F199ED5
MTSPRWTTLTEQLLRRENRRAEGTAWAMRQVISDNAPQASLAGFLIALRAKAESAEEIAGLADALLADTHPLVLDDTVDIVGVFTSRDDLMPISNFGSDRSSVNPQVSGGVRERFGRGSPGHGVLLAG